jgi:hypothetical protein
MSCYNWESGTIKLPSKDWAKFRTGLLKAWNKHETDRLEKAKRAHKALTEALKGKRGSKRVKALKEAVEARFTRRKYCSLNQRHINEDVDYEVREMVVTASGWGRERTYTLKGLPKKKDLKLFATSKDAEMHLGDAYVKFVNKTKTLVWSVSENNRAVEHAHEHWFAKLIFEALGKITWTRGSGGTLVGNDEYNRDAGREYEGGGGNYVTREFSQAKQKRDREAARRRPRGFYGGMTSRYY